MDTGCFTVDGVSIDLRRREIRRAGRVVRLQEQPFRILALLLERPGDVVPRDAIRQRLWPDGTTVDFEHGVNAAIKRLRVVLGDHAERPRFIETVPRWGYRFVGLPVSQHPSEANEPRPPAARAHAGGLPRVTSQAAGDGACVPGAAGGPCAAAAAPTPDLVAQVAQRVAAELAEALAGSLTRSAVAAAEGGQDGAQKYAGPFRRAGDRRRRASDGIGQHVN
jgi:DNA-binding winged helix-turn-helix (wHTH) protein